MDALFWVCPHLWAYLPGNLVATMAAPIVSGAWIAATVFLCSANFLQRRIPTPLGSAKPK